MLFHLIHYRFEAFFKIAPIACSGQKRTHIQRIYGCFGQDRWGLTLGDLAGQTFSNGGFPNPGITDQNWVVFPAATQHLDAALNFMFAANQWIHVALGRFFIEIDTIFRQCALFFRGLIAVAIQHLRLILGANNGPAFDKVWVFGYPMGDEIDGVIAGHVLLLQEIGRVAFAFGKYCNQNIGACDFCTTGGLHMNGGPLDHPLKGGGWYGL